MMKEEQMRFSIFYRYIVKKENLSWNGHRRCQYFSTGGGGGGGGGQSAEEREGRRFLIIRISK